MGNLAFTPLNLKGRGSLCKLQVKRLALDLLRDFLFNSYLSQDAVASQINTTPSA